MNTVPKVLKAIGQFVLRDDRLSKNIVEEVTDDTIKDFASDILPYIDDMCFKIAAIAAK